MVKRSVRAYVELAAGLGEVTRSKAVEAAHEIVALAGSDASRKKVAKQVGRVADDLLRAAEQNRAQVLALVQREVDSAVARVDLGRLLTEVQSLGSAVAGLGAQVDDLARAAGMRAAHGPRPDTADLAEPAPATPPVSATTTRRAPVKKAAARTAPAKKAAAAKAPARTTASAQKAAAKKVAAAKAPARKVVARTTAPAQKAPAQKAPAQKAPAQKAPAQKAPAQKAPAKKAPAKKAPAKRTARSSSTTSGAGA